MNPKEIIIPFIFALVSVWLFQTYFGSKVPEAQDLSGAQYQAPVSGVEVHKPLNLEIDFLDTKPSGYRFVKTTLETDDAKYVFSTEGASLQEVEFKRSFGNTQRWLQTIFPPNQYEREERCFLVALDQMTPYYYQLKDQKEDELSYTLIYESEVAQRALVKKTFTIFKKEYRIDDLNDLILEWREERRKVRLQLKNSFNHSFGSVFRTYQNPSFFANKIQKFADIYMSNVTNLERVSQDYVFYPNRSYLPQ